MNDLGTLADRQGLIVMGSVREVSEPMSQTIVLLGTGADFWHIFSASPEHLDGAPDPLDRWSVRVMEDLRAASNASDVVFPFGGPPYAPFLKWAQESGEAWPSPVGMLVHGQAGLMISFRGALVFDNPLSLPLPPKPSPCEACQQAPCRTACPVDALKGDDGGYDVAACHAYLDTPEGTDCLTHGCKARRACPVSIRFGRDPAQSAFHMKAFHPG